MQILASVAMLLRSRTRSAPCRPTKRPQAEGAFESFDVPAHPIGQRYSWGHPPTLTNGFAPAIGYDGHSGGNGY